MVTIKHSEMQSIKNSEQFKNKSIPKSRKAKLSTEIPVAKIKKIRKVKKAVIIAPETMSGDALKNWKAKEPRPMKPVTIVTTKKAKVIDPLVGTTLTFKNRSGLFSGLCISAGVKCLGIEVVMSEDKKRTFYPYREEIITE